MKAIKAVCRRKQREALSSAIALAGICYLLLFSAPAPASSERYHHDSAGRLTRVIYDDLSSIAYAYDANGNLLSVTTTAAGSSGDADLDGDVDDADVAAVVALVLAGGQPYSPTADCNGDERVSVLDVACTVNAKGGP